MLKEVKENHPELEIIEIEYKVGHAHMLISIPPKMSLRRVVKTVKAYRIKNLKENFKS
jgi:putative transposase